MEIAYMVTLILVLGGNAPETRVVAQGITTKEDCAFRVKTMTDMPPSLVDDVTGRKIISQTYVCAPIDPKKFRRDLDNL